MTKIVGIDLGTTFSSIAELDDLGNPEVLSDPESGNRITRSVAYFGKDKVIVGDKARDAYVTNPKKVVFEVKREMENEVIYSLSSGEFKEDDGKIKTCFFSENCRGPFNDLSCCTIRPPKSDRSYDFFRPKNLFFVIKLYYYQSIRTDLIELFR